MDTKIYLDCLNSLELSLSLENLLNDKDISIKDLTSKEILEEAKWVLFWFSEEGHYLYNGIHNIDSTPEDVKYAKKEFKILKDFIKKYDKIEETPKHLVALSRKMETLCGF